MRAVPGVLAFVGVLGVLSAAAAPSRPPDVLLITIDTLRADALGFAGNRRVETPALDRLAARGRVFTDAHAHNVVTLPSHANLLTGLHPYQHGVRENSGFRLSGDVPTLATVLRGAGYATAAFVGAYPLDSEFGLDRGFEVYDDRTTRGSEEELELAERRGDEVVGPALSWWHANARRPRFLWVHLYDPHAPYAPPEPFASRYAKEPYLGEVAAVDSFLAPLLEASKEALVVMTADHGESLGEHGELTHGLFAYEATLKVPLVVAGPGVPPGRDGRAARHVDVFPTVLQAAGVAAPRGERPGRSLLAPPGPPGSPEPVTYFEALSTNLNRGWAPLRGVLRQGRKLIALPLPELYDLRSDPGERRNRIDQDRPAARALIALLPQESVWPPRPGTLPAGDEQRLRSLGYIASAAPARASYGPEDDPKNLVHLDRKILRVVELHGLKRIGDAVALAREVVKERPSMPLGRSLLAQALLESGTPAAVGEALEVMQKARAEKVTTETLLRQLGLTLAEQGRVEEALEVLRPMAGSGDPRSRNALALALSEAGRQKEAYELLQKVLADDPGNAKALEQMGLIELRLGHWQQARDLSRRAVEARPNLPLAWNNLGVALYQLGRPGEALDAWQRAVDLKPDLWDALWNLGVKAAQHGRPRQARDALERFVAGAPGERYAGDVQKARGMLERLK